MNSLSIYCYCSQGTKPDQCWWSLGYPVAFLAHLHSRTGEPSYLQARPRATLGLASDCDATCSAGLTGGGEMRRGRPSPSPDPAVCVCVCVCDERPFPFAVPRMQTAEAILEFVGRCHEDSRSSIIAHKIMWGASLVGSLAGQARVLMHPVRSIVRWNRR